MNKKIENAKRILLKEDRFYDDDTEIKATRILNGVDKENIVEEDIKNLEKYIDLVINKNYCDCNELNVICYGKYADGSKNIASSIKNILQDYTRQKQINEEYKKNNKELIKTINIVEKEKSDWIKAYQEEKDKQFNILRDSIPKQKIKDKIEELNKQEQELQNSISEEERKEYSDTNISFQLCDIEIRREVLQEFLLESEDK